VRLREQAFKVVLDYSFGAASIVMPAVLARIGAEVLAVNPFPSTASATAAAEDPRPRIERVADLVRASASNLGFVIDPDGEYGVVVDDDGEILDHHQALLALLVLVAEAHPGARIALPLTVSAEAERLAAARGAAVVRTELSSASLMQVAETQDITFAGSPDGGFIWPDFMPAFDAQATLIKVLDLLAATERPLSTVVKQLPRIHIAHEMVSTPWERKGAVMRELVEQTDDEDLVLIDGVKIVHDQGWALVLPDPEQPLTHVWAESVSDQEARRLTQEYTRRIRALLR
jgi:mannose-1-phosphate guanylyltransferase/phosphomannomutase